MNRIYNILPTELLEKEELQKTAKWSGKYSLPSIGDKVHISMNDLGDGTVEAYFIEDEWLGVYVKLENPPDWWVKQTKKSNKDFGRRVGCAMVFGTEIRPIL